MFVCCVLCFVKVFESKQNTLLAESIHCLPAYTRQTSVEEEPSSEVEGVLAYADEG